MVPNLYDMRKGNSFFSFINDLIFPEASGFTNPALHRLCSMMRKMGVESSIVEKLAEKDKIIAGEVEALSKYFGKKIDFYAYRLTFISEFLPSVESVANVKEESFLSSSVVINYLNPENNIWDAYIYKSVVTIPKVPSRLGPIPLLNNFIHVYKVHDCEVNYDHGKKRDYKITGSFFCQQNSKTSVCAHASLCMTINNMEGKSEITPEDINKIIGVDHVDNKMVTSTRSGLTKKETLDVLENFGLSFVIRDYFSSNHEEDYNAFVYKYIEGRFPSLLVFTTSGSEAHVVPVLGHTLNTDMWGPEAEANYNAISEANYGDIPSNSLNVATPASAYVDHLIIHDDNFGMYFCLPVDSLKKIVLPKHDPYFRIFYAIAIIPNGVTTPAWEAEWASVAITKSILEQRSEDSLDNWCKRLASMNRPWVVRTFLVTKGDYSISLDEKDFEENELTLQQKESILNNLPEIFWLSEISLPDLYTANKHKIIDVYYPTDCKPLDKKYDEIHNRWIQVRAPHALLIRSDECDSFDVLELSIQSHVPLFHFKTQIETLEW